MLSVAACCAKVRMVELLMQENPRHQCLIYEGAPSRHLERVAQAFAVNFARNNRCFYMNSPAMVAGMRSSLWAVGVDVASQIERGALICSSGHDHLEDGEFRAEKMLATLETALAQALGDGYAGLFASGDMTWELGGTIDLQRLLEYEIALENMMQANVEFSGICQYHRESLPPAAVEIALRTHQGVRINETMMRFNPFHWACHAHQNRSHQTLGTADVDAMLDELRE
jgi:hypothetical protein